MVPEIAGYTFLETRSYGAARGLELAEFVLANTADAMVSQCFTARRNVFWLRLAECQHLKHHTHSKIASWSWWELPRAEAVTKLSALLACQELRMPEHFTSPFHPFPHLNQCSFHFLDIFEWHILKLRRQWWLLARGGLVSLNSSECTWFCYAAPDLAPDNSWHTNRPCGFSSRRMLTRLTSEINQSLGTSLHQKSQNITTWYNMQELWPL